MGIKMRRKYVLFFSLFVILPLFSVAQKDGMEEKFEDMESQDEELNQKLKNFQPKRVSDLAQLSLFSDIAVIQRRFMPKTGRISASLAGTSVLSSEYFLNTGLEIHFSYHFLEKHGLEFSSYYVFPYNRGVSNDLRTISANVSETVPIAQGFVGLAYKWMPIYGKIALYNRDILSFDTFFNLGGGASGLSLKSKKGFTWEPAVITGIGQVFALTRNFGFRWDLRWHLTIQVQSQMNLLSDFLFSAGFSYYYPSAGTR